MASTGDKVIMIFGWIMACIAGCSMPSFVFLIGYILDSFSPDVPQDEKDDTINLMSLIFVLIGLGSWILSFFYYTAFIVFSERIIKKTRLHYLRSILT